MHNFTYLVWLVSCYFFFFSSRRRHTRYWRDWSSDVCSSDLLDYQPNPGYASDSDSQDSDEFDPWTGQPRSQPHESSRSSRIKRAQSTVEDSDRKSVV